MSPRPKNIRKVNDMPVTAGFKPIGLNGCCKNTIFLHFEEYEAIRLCDYEMKTQQEASVSMGVSRPTLSRIYVSARQKIAKALVRGVTIMIEGGAAYTDSEWFRCGACGFLFNNINPALKIRKMECPACHSDDLSISNININKNEIMMKIAIRWAEQQDVTRLAQFLFAENKQIPLVCIGSGGSLSACHYAVQLYQQRNGVLAQAMTPLQLMYAGYNIIRSSKLLFLSASGKNKDILSAIKYGVKYNETGMMSLTLRKNNPTEELLEQYPKVQRWCENIPSEKDGFLATNSLLATFEVVSKC